MRIKLTNLISPVIAILILLVSVPLTAAAATPPQAIRAIRFSQDSQVSSGPLLVMGPKFHSRPWPTSSMEGAIRQSSVLTADAP